MSKSLPVISFQPDRHKRVRAGHPWGYSNELRLDAGAKALPAGSLVRLVTAGGDPLGIGFFNPHTLIAVRRLTDGEGAIDSAFLRHRLANALALRDRLFAKPYYRLIHAEADGMPGLVIDRYGDVLVVQLNCAGMDRLAEPLLAALLDLLQPRAVLWRNDSPARTQEGLETYVRWAHGTVEGVTELEENGVRFAIDLASGQKTGWFFDQRDNRAAAAAVAAGASVLDVYCYAGAFGVQAAVSGAASVLLVDRSKPALETALAAAALNNVADRCQTRAGDGGEIMEALAAEGARFDLVIADPPAFVKSKKDLAAGLRAYMKMTKQAASLLKPGGFLLVASCSHNVDVDAFANEVRGGLSRARRSGRILRSAGAASDHPVHPFLPESAYLKALLLQLD